MALRIRLQQINYATTINLTKCSEKTYLCGIATKLLSKCQRGSILCMCTANFNNVVELNRLEHIRNNQQHLLSMCSLLNLEIVITDT